MISKRSVQTYLHCVCLLDLRCLARLLVRAMAPQTSHGAVR